MNRHALNAAITRDDRLILAGEEATVEMEETDATDLALQIKDA